ncbi:MAG TPA: MFS transporter [Steroidobacteraceae bacterium]|jgi:MFS family permease|nr:MFS transporter [Steroidobacteraceae bacterium]
MTAGAVGRGGAAGAEGASSTVHVIGASALGTVFEWYDFFLYGALASDIAAHFFSGVGEATGFLFALATFAVGFIVRPVGALLFGRIGDLAGRKNTFLVTLALMGLSTFLVGALPGYDAIGIAAPLSLVALRLVQGLAIGGEYGGAIIFVAEHAPTERRGLFTSWIPATAVTGLLLSLAVIMATRLAMPSQAFAEWGWRLPFLVSLVLLAISLWIRMRLHESPVFRQMKAEQRLSRSPLSEAFLEWRNGRGVLIAIFGAVIGQAVTFYTATFYPLFFLERIARVDPAIGTMLVGVALVIAIPLVLAAGWLCDRIGRKPVLLMGVALASLLYFPAFGALLSAANPALAEAMRTSPVVAEVAREDCTLQFDLVGRKRFDRTSCDVVKSFLARAGIGHSTEPLAGPGPARLRIGDRLIAAPDGPVLAGTDATPAVARFGTLAKTALAEAGYPTSADPARIARARVVAILVGLLAALALCSGAYGALLVELFPARFRYSAVSVAQNVGNGWFGGLLPAIAFAIVAATGNVFAGLWYPVGVCVVCFLVALAAVPETRGRPIH